LQKTVRVINFQNGIRSYKNAWVEIDDELLEKKFLTSYLTEVFVLSIEFSILRIVSLLKVPGSEVRISVAST
jgi:hypothetical protein